jgi:hypothetical protein
LNRLLEIYMLFSLTFSWKGTLLPVLKGSNSSKHNFRMKDINLQMVCSI